MGHRLLLAVMMFLLVVSKPASALETSAPADPDQAQQVLMDMDLEGLRKIKVDTVYGASRFEQKVTEAPSSITIITADEIKKYGYRTLADIVNSVRSFYTTYDRSYHYVGVRGFGVPGDYNSRLLILIDGHRTNENIYLSGAIGTEFLLDVDLIERVEFIRGPSSSLYGTNAFFGVINIITRRGKDVNGAEVAGSAGSFETYKGRITYGNRWATGPELVLSASGYDSQGRDHLYFREFDDPATNNGIAEHLDYDRSAQYFGSLSFQDVTLLAGYTQRKKGSPAGAFETVFNDQRNNDIDKHGFAELEYKHDFGKQLNVMASISYDWYDYLWSGAFDMGAPDLVVNHDHARGEWWTGELQIVKKFWQAHIMTVGAEYQINVEQNLSNYDEAPPMIYSDIRKRTNNWALYLQDEYSLFSNLHLNAGVRYDHYDTFGGTTNPRVALIYNPYEETTLKLLYGRAFRAPNIFELYFESVPSNQISNPNLKPDVIETFELVLEQKMGKYLKGTIAGFYSRLDDLIGLTTDPLTGSDSYQNIGAYNVKGVELELAGRWPKGFEGRISYARQETKNRVTGADLSNSPQHLAKANCIVPLYRDKLFAGTEVLYVSARKTTSGDSVGSYYVANMTLLNRNLIKGLELSASIYNIFDTKYSDPVSEEQVVNAMQQDGRIYRVKLTYQF